MSTPRSFQGNCAGSRTDSTLNSSPSTEMVSCLATTFAWRFPSTESYFNRCASVAALVRSLTATKSMLVSPSAARMMFRPIRPNPLMPTLTAIESPLERRSERNRPADKQSILMNALAEGQTVRLYFDVAQRHSSRHFPSGMYFIYSLLTFGVFVVVSPYFLYQAIRYKKYIGSLGQRLGYLPVALNVDGEESIWIPAVAGCGALTATALAADLKARYPRLKLFLSTTTIAGQQVARRSLQHVDAVFYFPFDWAFIVRRTLNIVRPRVFIMMETEIWPNLLRLCRARGVKTVVINGRISSRSYPRYRLIRPFFRRVLANVDRFCMQSEESARRLIDLGADPSRVTVTGSLKFDSLEGLTPVPHGKPRERVLRFFRLSPNRVVLVAGSTVRGEEAAVFCAFARL